MTPSFSDARPLAARAVGSVLAGCRIEAVLHVGPVFTVYRAGDALGGGRYALKEYAPSNLCERDAQGAPRLRDPSDAAASAAFDAGRAACLEEWRLLARLRLPGLVPVLQASEAQACPCALMPLLPGVPLSRREPPRDDAALRELFTALLEPLSQVHAAGLVHGGLHGDQLLWAPNQRPVLLGYGYAARALCLPQALEQVAPELRPEGAHLPRGPWTDLYALAATVLQHVTGQPWDGSADAADMAAALDAALPTPAGVLRPRLVQALHACLRPSPTGRPEGALALRALLGGGPGAGPAQAAAGRAPSAGPAGVPPPLRETPGPRVAPAPAAAPAAMPPAEAKAPAFAFMSPAQAAENLGQGRPGAFPAGEPARGGATGRAEPGAVPTPPSGVEPDALSGAFAPADAGLGPDFTADAGLRAAHPVSAPPRSERPSPRVLAAWAASALVLAAGLGLGAWWVQGLWQAEQEREHLGRLMAEAAAQASASAPAGGAVQRWGPGLGMAEDGPGLEAPAGAGRGPQALSGGVASTTGSGLPGASNGAAAGGWPAAPAALGLPRGATGPAGPDATAPSATRSAAAVAQATAPEGEGRHSAGAQARRAPPHREPEGGRGGDAPAQAGAAPDTLLASLPPTPLAACVSQAKSALERCMREQCAKDAWRSHALCRQPREGVE